MEKKAEFTQPSVTRLGTVGEITLASASTRATDVPQGSPVSGVDSVTGS